MFLGRNSIVVLNINLLEDSYEAYLQDVMYIINSFKFERGYEYKEWLLNRQAGRINAEKQSQ